MLPLYVPVMPDAAAQLVVRRTAPCHPGDPPARERSPRTRESGHAGLATLELTEHSSPHHSVRDPGSTVWVGEHSTDASRAWMRAREGRALVTDNLRLMVQSELLDVRHSSKPWKTARLIAGNISQSTEAVSKVLEHAWRHETPQWTRPSYYPSKRTLELLWAHTDHVGRAPRKTDIAKIPDDSSSGIGVDAAASPRHETTPLFLSHSHADEELAFHLRRLLASKGYDLWLAEAEVAGGEIIADAIRQSILSAEAVLVLVSAHSIGSRWVGKEIDLARSIPELGAVILIADTSDSRFVGCLENGAPSERELRELVPKTAEYKISWRRNAKGFFETIRALATRNGVCGFPEVTVELDGGTVRYKSVPDHLNDLGIRGREIPQDPGGSGVVTGR